MAIDTWDRTILLAHPVLNALLGMNRQQGVEAWELHPYRSESDYQPDEPTAEQIRAEYKAKVQRIRQWQRNGRSGRERHS